MRGWNPTLSALIGFVFASVLCIGCAAPPEPSEASAEADAPADPRQAAWPPPSGLVDLTHALGEDTIFWPTDTQGFELEELFAGVTDAGFYYAANRFSTAEHGGTHLDAPIHFAAQGDTVDEIPLERLIGPAIVVDVTEGSSNDPDYQVSVADFEAWEAEHGRLADGVIVLLHTGWSDRWGDREAYLGTAKLGDEAVSELRFPGLHPDAATWLVGERRIGAIGLDTASIDYGRSTLFESHVTLFAADIPAFENLTNLDQLPATGATVVALPAKIRGGSGAPLRAVAWW